MKSIVYDAITELCGCINITDNMSLEFDLGLDSLNRILLIINLEEKACVKFETSDINPDELLTVDNLISLLQKYEV